MVMGLLFWMWLRKRKMRSKEAYFDYLNQRLDSGESKNVAIYATVESIERQLQNKERIKVLDVGCFSGAMLNRIFRELSEESQVRIDLFGIDSDIEATEHGRKKYGNIEYWQVNIEDGLDMEGKFDIVMLVNVLHELFPKTNLDARKKKISEVFLDVASLLSDGGEIILLDGLRPDNPNQIVEVTLTSDEWIDRFEKLGNEYAVAELFVQRIGDRQIRTDVLGLAIFITKARYVNEDYWESEAQQLYQYYNHNDFIRLVQDAGLELVRFEPQPLKSEIWKEMIDKVNPDGVFPAKNVLIVARKSIRC